MRGLDYYNGMVFEWTTDKLGAQATVCAGGRYDGLVKQLGGSDTPAVGFAMGMERVLLMLQELRKLPPTLEKQVDVFIAIIGEENIPRGLALADELRRKNPVLRVLTHCAGGKYNSQLKKAYASQASWALVLEGSEIKLKMLDDDGQSSILAEQDVAARITTLFNDAGA